MLSGAYNYLWGSKSDPNNNNNEFDAQHATKHKKKKNKMLCISPSDDSIASKSDLSIASNDFDEKESKVNNDSKPNTNSQFLPLRLDSQSLSSLQSLRIVFDMAQNNNSHNNSHNNNSNNSKSILINENFAMAPKLDIESDTETKDNSDNDKTVETVANSKDKDGSGSYFKKLGFSTDEIDELNNLCIWLQNDKLSMKMINSDMICLGDLILSYFASFSDSNPNPIGCWKRWIKFKNDQSLIKYKIVKSDIQYNDYIKFLDSGVLGIAHTNKKLPVIIVNTEHYDDSASTEIVYKTCLLCLMSLIWDQTNDEFNVTALRKGVSCYMNLSHMTVGLMRWATMKQVKKSLIAFPYIMAQSYAVNAPMFLQLLRQFFAKILVPHAMDKYLVLDSMEAFLGDIASPSDVPTMCGGTSKITVSKWMQDRGYLEI